MHGFWLLLALNGVTAPQAAPAPCAAALCWNVKPQICVTEQANQPCQADLQVQWYSQQKLSPCLFLAEQLIQCWQDSTAGNWQQPLSWQHTELSLRSSDNTVLLQTELKVLSRKPMRRRIASPWSIF